VVTPTPGSGEGANSPNDLADLLRRGMEIFSSGDYEAALRFFHADAEIDSSAAFVVHGAYRGIEGVREFYGTIAEAFEEFRVEPQEIHVSGDRALVIAKTVARPRDSNETLTGEEFDLWTIRDGLAVRLEIFFDRFEAEAAFAGEGDAS
jgi:ketosteroid isomerase-like protein